ncbi:MAG TPA: molybdopterin cofactor-binding domain-containing protein, partial [Acidimicrobiia bacterium]|nr:molybdopterin cofactor-binding domain-containing protein [Acidimicrobiia bacterium]
MQRRSFLKGFLIAGPTLAIGARLGWDDRAGAYPTRTDEVPDVQDFTDYLVLSETPTLYDLLIEIRPDSRVYFELPRMEVGQGVMTAVGMMVADNLDVPFENMDIVLSKAEPKRANAQATGGSHSIRALWDPVRIICARMRGQLMAAASLRLGAPVSALRTQDGHVVATDGRKVPYGDLAAEASRLPPAKAALPKRSEDFKIIGRPQVKYGADKIVRGRYPYAMDLFPSKECSPTVVAMAPTHGATVVSIDDSEARKIPGVIAVTHVPGMPDYLIPEAVAVTAETFGIAKRAKSALRITWSAGPMDHMSDPQIDDMLNGIIDAVTSPGEGIDATFRWPYVPHAPMEENTAVADVRADSAEVWGGCQIPN